MLGQKLLEVITNECIVPLNTKLSWTLTYSCLHGALFTLTLWFASFIGLTDKLTVNLDIQTSKLNNEIMMHFKSFFIMPDETFSIKQDKSSSRRSAKHTFIDFITTQGIAQDQHVCMPILSYVVVFLMCSVSDVLSFTVKYEVLNFPEIVFILFLTLGDMVQHKQSRFAKVFGRVILFFLFLVLLSYFVLVFAAGGHILSSRFTNICISF